MSNLLVSVHMPKTAGSSFRKSLEKYFGEELLRDYGDYPINTSPLRRNIDAYCKSRLLKYRGDHLLGRVSCVHGHFLPCKYGTLQGARYITWLREPVERLVSHYYYWKKTYHPLNAKPLQRRVVEEDWSLMQFCLSKEMRNFYGQFFWRFPISDFDFIGITEFYDSDFDYFSKKFLGTSLQTFHENMNTFKSDETQIFTSDDSFRLEVEEFHRKDVLLYQYALELRNKRLEACE